MFEKTFWAFKNALGFNLGADPVSIDISNTEEEDFYFKAWFVLNDNSTLRINYPNAEDDFNHKEYINGNGRSAMISSLVRVIKALNKTQKEELFRFIYNNRFNNTRQGL